MIEINQGIKQYSFAADGDDTFCVNGKATHFKVREFACKDGTNFMLIDSELIEKLEVLRTYFNTPVIINSAFRTEKHNKEVGGAANSQHLHGRAADIVVKGVNPETVANFAVKIGFRGIGKYKNFTHVDTRDGNVTIWVG